MKPNQQFVNSLKSQPAITFNITASTPNIRTQLGDETIIQISQSGWINITGTGSARILVVGGGGAGSGGSATSNGNKGGGGGQVIDAYYNLVPGSYSVTIGAGGIHPAGNGGSSVVNTITPVAASGKGSGASGNLGNYSGGIFYSSFAGAEENWYDYLPPVRYVSGGGAGASLQVFKGNGLTFSGGAAVSWNGTAWVPGGNGLPGGGEYSDITGSNIEFGRGGYGGLRAATASYTSGAANAPAGYIDYNGGGTPFAVNAEVAYPAGAGGNGGAKASTLTAASSDGAKGIVIIRFKEI